MEHRKDQERQKNGYELPQKISRRKFLSGAGWLIGGAVAYAAGSGALFYSAAMENKKQGKTRPVQNQTLVLLGEKSKYTQIQDVAKVDYNTDIQDGWVTQNINGFVYMNKDREGNLLIMSPICTHLGCTVPTASEEAKQKNPRLAFLCPCHGGEYDATGINIGGPPPRPLDVFEPIEQEGKLYFNYFAPIQRKK